VAVVYATDAALEGRVRVLLEAEADDAPPIVYRAALIGGARRPPRPVAEAFLSWLAGPQAAAAFEREGFVVLGR
jgi:molybdate transport system substrate-binding protein